MASSQPPSQSKALVPMQRTNGAGGIGSLALSLPMNPSPLKPPGLHPQTYFATGARQSKARHSAGVAYGRLRSSVTRPLAEAAGTASGRHHRSRWSLDVDGDEADAYEHDETSGDDWEHGDGARRREDANAEDEHRREADAACAGCAALSLRLSESLGLAAELQRVAQEARGDALRESNRQIERREHALLRESERQSDEQQRLLRHAEAEASSLRAQLVELQLQARAREDEASSGRELIMEESAAMRRELQEQKRRTAESEAAAEALRKKNVQLARDVREAAAAAEARVAGAAASAAREARSAREARDACASHDRKVNESAATLRALTETLEASSAQRVSASEAADVQSRHDARLLLDVERGIAEIERRTDEMQTKHRQVLQHEQEAHRREMNIARRDMQTALTAAASRHQREARDAEQRLLLQQRRELELQAASLRAEADKQMSSLTGAHRAALAAIEADAHALRVRVDEERHARGVAEAKFHDDLAVERVRIEAECKATTEARIADIEDRCQRERSERDGLLGLREQELRDANALNQQLTSRVRALEVERDRAVLLLGEREEAWTQASASLERRAAEASAAVESKLLEEVKRVTATAESIGRELHGAQEAHRLLSLKYEDMQRDNERLQSLRQESQRHAEDSEAKVVRSLAMHREQQAHVGELQRRELELQAALELETERHARVKTAAIAECRWYATELEALMATIRGHGTAMDGLRSAKADACSLCEDVSLALKEEEMHRGRQQRKYEMQLETMAYEHRQEVDAASRTVEELHGWLGSTVGELVDAVGEERRRMLAACDSHSRTRALVIRDEIVQVVTETRMLAETSGRAQEAVSRSMRMRVDALERRNAELEEDRKELIERSTSDVEAISKERTSLQAEVEALRRSLRREQQEHSVRLESAAGSVSLLCELASARGEEQAVASLASSAKLQEMSSMLVHTSSLIDSLLCIVANGEYEKDVMRRSFEEERRRLLAQLRQTQESLTAQQLELSAKVAYYQESVVTGYEEEACILRSTVDTMQKRLGECVHERSRLEARERQLTAEVMQQHIAMDLQAKGMLQMREELGAVSGELVLLRSAAVERKQQLEAHERQKQAYSMLLQGSDTRTTAGGELLMNHSSSRHTMTMMAIEGSRAHHQQENGDADSSRRRRVLRMYSKLFVGLLRTGALLASGGPPIVGGRAREQRVLVRFARIFTGMLRRERDQERRLCRQYRADVERLAGDVRRFEEELQRREVKVLSMRNAVEMHLRGVDTGAHGGTGSVGGDETTMMEEAKQAIDTMYSKVCTLETELLSLRDERDALAQGSEEAMARQAEVERQLVEAEAALAALRSAADKQPPRRELEAVQKMERRLRERQIAFREMVAQRDDDQAAVFKRHLSLCASAIDKSYKYFKKSSARASESMEQLHDDVFVVMSSARVAVEVLRKDLRSIRRSVEESAGPAKQVPPPQQNRRRHRAQSRGPGERSTDEQQQVMALESETKADASAPMLEAGASLEVVAMSVSKMNPLFISDDSATGGRGVTSASPFAVSEPMMADRGSLMASDHPDNDDEDGGDSSPSEYGDVYRLRSKVYKAADLHQRIAATLKSRRGDKRRTKSASSASASTSK